MNDPLRTNTLHVFHWSNQRPSPVTIKELEYLESVTEAFQSTSYRIRLLRRCKEHINCPAAATPLSIHDENMLRVFPKFLKGLINKRAIEELYSAKASHEIAVNFAELKRSEFQKDCIKLRQSFARAAGVEPV